ncbi:histidine phosphatase family protein [Rickettsiales endosymbiont of Stachyamoeba lipophora]|uniref:histidine phosphatase family protein n=1 Tax=Rickettsiales endosymbiont of Stachyamoeba lipophora TaxID=2486578 RepID=UPI000F64668B|nr:histidine phosphatase family protein [Rickettsiales endosymbiont of Stachyamoeba lipophora]AZL15736.1 hypothetical protein EF513_04140 [Rickettsiales endosymbiont of Stachyamoeba lipophora]
MLENNWASGLTISSGAESADEFTTRIIKHLSEILEGYSHRLIVSHGGVYSALIKVSGLFNREA